MVPFRGEKKMDKPCPQSSVLTPGDRVLSVSKGVLLGSTDFRRSLQPVYVPPPGTLSESELILK